MKNNPSLRTALSLLLLLALMVGVVWGANAVSAPIVAENERLAAEAAAEAEKALLGDSVKLYDRADPAGSSLEVTADTVQSVYRDDTKQSYLLRLATYEGYTKDVPIELVLVVDFEGKIISLEVESSGETKELDPAFLPSFAGEDSTLAGVELVAGVTFSSSAIRNAVNDGFDTLISNGLFAAAEKSADQLLSELVAVVFPGLVNSSGVPQGEELAGEGRIERGIKAANGSGFAWFVDDGEKLLAVVSTLGGVKLYNAAGEDVTAANAALADEIRALSDRQAASGGRRARSGRASGLCRLRHGRLRRRDRRRHALRLRGAALRLLQRGHGALLRARRKRRDHRLPREGADPLRRILQQLHARRAELPRGLHRPHARELDGRAGAHHRRHREHRRGHGRDGRRV